MIQKKKSQDLIQSINNALLQLRLIAITWLMFNIHYIVPIYTFLFLFYLELSIWLLGISLILPIYLMFCKYTNTTMWEFGRFRSSFVMQDIQKYFGGRIIATEKLDETQQYIFGFHPHGTLTATALWCHNTTEWREKVSKKHLVTLAGSQVFYVPGLREFVMAAGGGMITRQMFSKVLEQGKSVLLVPGGVAEMKFSNSINKDITIVTTHKGFIRFALKHGVNLVPVFSFGETQIFDPFFPAAQKLFFRYLGIPLPLFFGKFLQIPRSCNITVVVGKPVKVNKNEHFTEEDVDRIHQQYFLSLHQLFEDHKGNCDHSSHKLILKDFEIHKEK